MPEIAHLGSLGFNFQTSWILPNLPPGNSTKACMCDPAIFPSFYLTAWSMLCLGRSRFSYFPRGVGVCVARAPAPRWALIPLWGSYPLPWSWSVSHRLWAERGSAIWWPLGCSVIAEPLICFSGLGCLADTKVCQASVRPVTPDAVGDPAATPMSPTGPFNLWQGTDALAALRQDNPFAPCSLIPLKEQSSALLVQDLAPSEPDDSWWFPPNPFEGSQLSVFSAVSSGRKWRVFWALVCMNGANHPCTVPQDRMQHLFWQNSLFMERIILFHQPGW